MRLKGPYLYERLYEPNQSQTSFYMEIPFSHLEESRISIANRTLVNECSGRLRHLGRLPGLRIIDDKAVTKSEEMYVFHWDYSRHFKELGITEDNESLVLVNGNRDLGNNDWHIAWQHNPPEQFVISTGDVPQDRLVRLKDEPWQTRTYNCLIVPHRGQGHPYIDDVKVDSNQNVINAHSKEDVSEQIDWLTYGKPLIRHGDVIDIQDPDIIAQFGGDIRHILELSDREATAFNDKIDGNFVFTEKTSNKEQARILNWIYEDYPTYLVSRALHALRNMKVPRAKYYFNVVGTKEDALIVCHREGTLEEVGHYLRARDVIEALILDEGGSVACWGSWNGPQGGFINVSYYFRPKSISCIAFFLK